LLVARSCFVKKMGLEAILGRFENTADRTGTRQPCSRVGLTQTVGHQRAQPPGRESLFLFCVLCQSVQDASSPHLFPNCPCTANTPPVPQAPRTPARSPLVVDLVFCLTLQQLRKASSCGGQQSLRPRLAITAGARLPSYSIRFDSRMYSSTVPSGARLWVGAEVNVLTYDNTH